MHKIILASSSPRRRELLSKVADFSVCVPDAEELQSGDPVFVAQKNALLKGRSIKEECDVVIACDTVVALDGKIYGKPGTADNAVKMLQALRGRAHEVISGVYVRTDEELVFFERSTVRIKKLSDREIKNYVDNYSPLDKAGAYGIQDGEIVEGYDGDYDNIVGLPMERITKILMEKGYAKG